MSSELEFFIKKAALENAVKFNGQANPKALIGKALGEFSDAKKDMKSLMQIIHTITAQINSLTVEEQQTQLESLGGATPKKEKQKGLKELTGARPGNVVMRFAPSPSGPMHIGHAITGGLTSAYVKKYGGKFFLRIEDTNSENIYEPAYDMLVEDANWLFGNVDEVVIQSDRMQLYYKYAKDMIAKRLLYVDTSSGDEFRTFSDKKIDPPSKSRSVKEHLQLFEDMCNGNIREGEAVVRFNGDMNHKNPAMRDFPLFRINTTPHPKTQTQYRVWPLMNFSVFVDDLELGMTHIIRGKDHVDNAKRQELLFESIGKNPPVSYFIGRYKFTDLELSSTKTREKIDAGLFCGWDDIRLPTVCALKKRGFQAKAFLDFVQETGMTLVDKLVDKQEFFQSIESFNTQIIDEKANRYFCIQDPVEIQIDKIQDVELDLHPTLRKKGRKLTVQNNIIIEQSDTEKLERGVVRLIDFCNIHQNTVVSDTYDEYKNEPTKSGIIHWLPNDPNQLILTEIHMPDGSIICAQAEKTILRQNQEDIIQFERFGFCRIIEKKTDSLVCWFTHG